jgi:hypothetical protein
VLCEAVKTDSRFVAAWRPWGRLLRLQNKAGSALKSLGYFKTQEGCMPTGKVKMFNEQRGFGFISVPSGMWLKFGVARSPVT